MSAHHPITEGHHYDVDPDSGCWDWKKRIDRYGYGRSTHGELAHRRSYRENVGMVPDGYQLDHVCRNRACVNPAHLEPVTQAENRRRGLAARGFVVDDQLCGFGHDLSDAYIDANGQRRCRECRRGWAMDYVRRQRALRVAS